MNCEYVRNYYGVPAEIGRRVIACGEPGIIAEDRGGRIGILLDKDKPGRVGSYHPTWKIEYLDMMSKVRQPTRAQARYKRFVEYGDCFGSFIEFCRWDADPSHSWNAR